jgi:hypothetical protein
MTRMTDDDYGPYGDSESNPDAALLEHTLRQLLTHVPDAHPADADGPVEMAAQIHDAVHLAWPDGHPPTLDELPPHLESYPEGSHEFHSAHEFGAELEAAAAPPSESDGVYEADHLVVHESDHHTATPNDDGII